MKLSIITLAMAVLFSPRGGVFTYGMHTFLIDIQDVQNSYHLVTADFQSAAKRTLQTTSIFFTKHPHHRSECDVL